MGVIPERPLIAPAIRVGVGAFWEAGALSRGYFLTMMMMIRVAWLHGCMAAAWEARKLLGRV